jgi:restriction system protein
MPGPPSEIDRRSPAWLRLGTRCANWWRMLGRRSHKWRIDQAARVIRTIREFEGDALSARTLGYLRKVEPLVFEEVVLTCLEESGSAVWRSGAYTGDGGIDGLAHFKQWGFMAIQVKRYKSHICREHVLEFHQLLQRRGYARGLFVHTGKTGVELLSSLRNSQIYLCSGEKLAQLVRYAALRI